MLVGWTGRRKVQRSWSTVPPAVGMSRARATTRPPMPRQHRPGPGRRAACVVRSAAPSAPPLRQAPVFTTADHVRALRNRVAHHAPVTDGVSARSDRPPGARCECRSARRGGPTASGLFHQALIPSALSLLPSPTLALLAGAPASTQRVSVESVGAEVMDITAVGELQSAPVPILVLIETGPRIRAVRHAPHHHRFVRAAGDSFTRQRNGERHFPVPPGDLVRADLFPTWSFLECRVDLRLDRCPLSSLPPRPVVRRHRCRWRQPPM